MGLPAFRYFRPERLAELEDLLAEYGDQARILAGGTDLMVQMKAGIQKPAAVIDIGSFEALRGITYEPGQGTTILAGTKITDLEHSSLIRDKLPALYDSVRLLGSPQVRYMATLGGNACNASPSAETPPILIALGCQATIAGKGRERKIPLESFFLAYRRVDLNPGEYLKSFSIPEQPSGAGSAYLCRMLRRAMEIDIVNTGAWLRLDSEGICREARIVLGSVAPVPLRATKSEEALIGRPSNQEAFQQAGAVASRESSPIDDIRGSAEYRREMVEVVVRRALKAAFSRINPAFRI